MRSTICIITLVLFGVLETCGRPQRTKPGCRYDGKPYQESSAVNTSEPCLLCSCYEGSLRCRLRVCPRIPNPLPSGCTTRVSHENACCAELICDEHRCIWDGVHYAVGSAMMGSRRCEYCYCISGERRCVRPQCLLPLPGCTPLYAPYSCCPVAYNCTHALHQSMPLSRNGCKVGDHCYKEGEMVRATEWKTMCDNCFCAMGGIRCVPLACAPPLQGCTPIVREGQCCPSTYNCSGSIAVKSTKNFASYAFISKDYAKLRKETNFLIPNEFQATSTIEGRSHHDNNHLHLALQETPAVEDEQSTTASITLEVISSTMTYETETMNNEIPTEGVDYPKSSASLAESSTMTTQSPTTSDQLIETSSNNETMFTVSDGNNTTINYPLPVDSAISATIDYTLMSAPDTTISPENLLDVESVKHNESSQFTTALEKYNWTATMGIDEVDRNGTTEYPQIIFETTLNQVRETVRGVEKESSMGMTEAMVMPVDILVINVTLKTNVSVAAVERTSSDSDEPHASHDIERIVNITDNTNGQDYDEYDYSEPTLPPSLPNVRIIPFVAADALIKDKESTSSSVTHHIGSIGVPPEIRPIDVLSSGRPGSFYDTVTHDNVFSPPLETQGGFVPREPSYFETQYHSPTDLSLEIGTGVTVVLADIIDSHRKNNDHSVEESAMAVLATGNDPGSVGNLQVSSVDPFRDVIRTDPAPDLPSLIDDMIPYLQHQISSPATPSLYLNKQIAQSDLNFRDGSVDKYEDVIITTEEPSESKPPLPVIQTDEKIIEITTKFINNSSINYDDFTSVSFTLLPSSITIDPPNFDDFIKSKEIVSSIGEQSAGEQDFFFHDQKLIPLSHNISSFSNGYLNDAQNSSRISTNITSDISGINNNTANATKEDNMEIVPIGGLLKLAGCNIYGRMYRVGRIIVELSTLCIECRCTHLGVQCKQLDC